jgi:hypothetical protein
VDAPFIAATPNGGLAILFYDFRRDVLGDAALSTDAWLRTSDDGGRTWRERHLGGSFDYRSSPTIGSRPYGDYLGIAADRCDIVTAFVLGDPFAVHGGTDYFFARERVGPTPCSSVPARSG